MVTQERHLCDVAVCRPSSDVLEAAQNIQVGDRLNEESRHDVSAHSTCASACVFILAIIDTCTRNSPGRYSAGDPAEGR